MRKDIKIIQNLEAMKWSSFLNKI